MEQGVQEEKSRLYFRLMLILSGISYAMVLLFNIFRWTIVDQVTVFIASFFGMLVYGLFYGILIVSFLYVLLTRSNRVRRRNTIPLLIGIVVLGVVVKFPFTAYAMDFDYKTKLDERNEAVEWIHSKELASADRPFTLPLPDEFRTLSKGGGEVTVQGEGGNQEILFYTFRGVVDHYSGFIYTEDGQYPNLFGGDSVESKRYSEHWFWVRAS